MLVDINAVKSDLQKEKDRFESNIGGLRTGVPAIGAFKDVYVDYYGSPTALQHVASFSQNGLTFTFKVFDPSTTKKIEDAINNAQIGAKALATDTTTVIVNFVPMTGEVRQEQVKLLNGMLEEARVAIRQKVRRKYMETIDSMEKVSEDDQERSRELVQKIVDEAIDEIELTASVKEKAILAV